MITAFISVPARFNLSVRLSRLESFYLYREAVLSFVHRHKVIHRDIKPSNLMRRHKDGKIVLIDFGAVKQVQTQVVNSQGQTTFSRIIGTPGYMPQEQGVGKPRFSSDIYALGMVATEALTGLAPSQLSEDVRTGEVIWQDQTYISPQLAIILDKMVRSHLKERYQSVDEVLNDLRDLRQSSSTKQTLVVPGLNRQQSVQLQNKSLIWQQAVIMGSVVGVVVIMTTSQTSSPRSSIQPPFTQPDLTSTTAQPSPQQRISEPTLPVVVKLKPSPESDDKPAMPTSNSPTNFVPNISHTSPDTKESRTTERPQIETSDEKPLNHTAEIPLGSYSFYEKNFQKYVSYIRSDNKMVGAFYNSQRPDTITCFTANIDNNKVYVVWWHNLWQINHQEERLYSKYSIEDFAVDNIDFKQGLDNPTSVKKCRSQE